MKTSRLDCSEDRRNNRRGEKPKRTTMQLSQDLGEVRCLASSGPPMWVTSPPKTISSYHNDVQVVFMCLDGTDTSALFHSLVLWTRRHTQAPTSRLLYVSWVSRWKRTRPFKLNEISSRIIERDRWKWRLQLGVEGNVKDGHADTQSLTCSWHQLLSFANSSITAADDEGRGASSGTGLELVVLQRCDAPFLIICLTSGWIWGLPPLGI